MTIASLSKSLFLNKEGIWTSRSKSKVNYPKDGNISCSFVEDNSYWFLHRNDCILASIRRFPPSGAILDIGGGNGFVAQIILAAGYPIALLEPGEIGARNAKYIRNIPEVINSTFEDAKFPAESLFAVSLFDVLEHVENDKNFMLQIWHSLKPGGFLYATVPAHNYLWSSSDNYAEHFRRYNLKMIRNLTDKYFSLRYYTALFSALLIPTLFLRVLPYRLNPVKIGQILSLDSEHGTKGGLLISILSFLLKREYLNIKRGEQVKFGTSYLFVLEKIIV